MNLNIKNFKIQRSPLGGTNFKGQRQIKKKLIDLIPSSPTGGICNLFLKEITFLLFLKMKKKL